MVTDQPRSTALLVRSAGIVCAIPVEHVREVMRPLASRAVSGAPPWVLGVSVLRGAAVPVVSLAALLSAAPPSPPARLVSLRVADRSVALAVDEVLGVRDCDPRPAPPLLTKAAGGLIASLSDLDAQLLVVLNAARLLPQGEEGEP